MMRPDLDRAYRETLYEVATDPPMCWVVGEPNSAWAQIQSAHGVSASTFITAHNPFSERQVDEANQTRQKALEQALTEAGWAWVPAWGRHPTNQWPVEVGVVVWGMDEHDARPWALRFRQHATVGMDAQGWARLHWHSDMNA